MGNYANFYNSYNNDRVYDAESFAEWLKPFFVNGVFNGQMQVVENNGMEVRVKPGYAYIDGKNRFFEEDTILTIDSSHSTLHRIDNIVVRRNDTNRNITLEVIKGTSSASPVAPAATRSNGVNDLVIAQVYVAAAAIKITQANITDTRANGDLCGWVTGSVKEIDFDQITAQFSAYFNDFKNTNLEEFNTWFNSIKDILGEDEAAQLLALIQELQTSVSNVYTKSQTDALISNIKTVREVTVDTSSWVLEGDFYTKTVTVGGLTANDSPVIDLKYSNIKNTDEVAEEQYNLIHNIVAVDNGLKIYADEALVSSVTLLIKGV